jgi:hypothetical protein
LKGWEDSFDQNDLIEEPQEVVLNMPKGMKKKSIFYELTCREIDIKALLATVYRTAG